jgi:hypothetical protein
MKRGPQYRNGPFQQGPKIPRNTWIHYNTLQRGVHGFSISGEGHRYQCRIVDNPNFCPPEVIGKRICWIASQINPNGALLYRMSYGSLP